MKHVTYSWLAGCLILFVPQLLLAENSTRVAGYNIHHNAITTATLSPQIASGYGIVRSKYRGMLNVTVIKEMPDTLGKAVSAKIDAVVQTLTGQTSNIKLREIREGGAIYYIGTFPITHREIFNFKLQVTPEGTEYPLTAKLSQQFFID